MNTGKTSAAILSPNYSTASRPWLNSIPVPVGANSFAKSEGLNLVSMFYLPFESHPVNPNSQSEL